MLLRIVTTQLLVLVGCASAESTSSWHSAALVRDVMLRTTLPPGAKTTPASAPGVVVLRNIGPASATKSSAAETLLRDGNALIELDYQADPNATVDTLTLDLLKIRADLKEKRLVLDPSVDIDRLWILPEGYALKRDVSFFTNDQKTWRLDIAYPLDAPERVPTLMEITCDNARRMGNSSLVYCQDTLLEGALLRGFAAAMIDHPVPSPYKGLDDPMPDLIHRLKSAVRTIRAHSQPMKLNGKIGAVGFSRGGPMAAFLAVTNGRREFEVGGESPDVSSDVQAALVHGNRYDYSRLLVDDPMRSRFERAWGRFEENRERWLAHGAVAYLQGPAAPMYLSTSDTESAEYREGVRVLRDHLADRKSEHIYAEDADGRGHRVTTEPRRLEAIYRFLGEHLRS